MKTLIRSKSESNFFFLNQNLNLINHNLNNIQDLKTYKISNYKQKSKRIF